MEREIISTKVRVKMDEFNQEKAQISFDYYIGPIMDESARELCEAIPLQYLTPVAIPSAPVVKTQSRSLTSNVATVKTQSEHFLKVSDAPVIAGMADSGYNGTKTVTVIVDARTFKFALTHADEIETGDSGGTVTAPTAQLFVSADKKIYIPVPGDYLRLYEIKFPSWIVPVRDAAKIDSPEGKMQDNPYLSAGKGRPSVMIKNLTPTGGVYGKFFVCGRCDLQETPSSAFYVKAPLAEELTEKLIDAVTWLAASKMFIVNAMGDKAKPCYEQYVLSVQSLSKT